MVRPEDDLELVLIKNSLVLKTLNLAKATDETAQAENRKPFKAGGRTSARVIANLGETSDPKRDFAVKDVEIIKGENIF